MKQLIKKLFSKFNLKVQQIDTPMRSLERGLALLSQHVKPDWVIDIGVANGTPELYHAFPATNHHYFLVEADPTHAQVIEKLRHMIRTPKSGHESVHFFVFKIQSFVS